MTDKFWVGGTGTWNTANTANWSLTSGGATGAATPVAGDRVFIDANSGSGTISRLTNAATCASLDCTGYTGTLSTGGVATTFDTGDVKLVAGMTFTAGAGVWTFSAVSNQNVTSAGKIMPPITMSGAGGGITLLDNLSIGAATCTLTRGTLALNGFTFVLGTFSSSNANVRSITFGAGGTLQSAASTGFAWTTNTITNLTVGTGGKIIIFGLGSPTSTITSVSGITIPAIEIYGVTGASGPSCTFDSAAALTSLYARAASTGGGSLTFKQATTINGDCVVKKPTYANIVGNVTILSDVAATPRTITANGVIRLEGVEIQDITGAGSTWWARGGSVDISGNSNINFSGGSDGEDVRGLGSFGFLT